MINNICKRSDKSNLINETMTFEKMILL